MADLTHLPTSDRADLDLPAGLAVFAGAVIGGLAGYVLLTPRGARLRQDLDGVVDRLFGGVDSVLDGWQQARARAGSAGPSLPFEDGDQPATPEAFSQRRHSF